MKKHNLHIDDALIIKVLSGQASEPETTQLNLWLDENPNNKNIADKIEHVLNLVNEVKSSKRHERNWNSIQQKIKQQYQTPAYITITQDNPKSVSLLRKQWMRIAASIVIIIGLGLIFNYTIKTDKTHNIVVSSPTPEICLLPDGSEITLNTGSILTYTRQFNKNIREVTLTGEAYFSVAKNDKKPFVIYTLNTTTKVVGTAFNVLTDTILKEVQISVESGKVEFYCSEAPTSKVYLTKGEEGVFNLETQELIKREISDINFLSWKTGVLEFDGTPLNKVFETLEKQYNTNIISRDKTIEDLRLTSKYSDQTLKQIFNELKLLLDVDYEIINDTIYIK